MSSRGERTRAPTAWRSVAWLVLLATALCAAVIVQHVVPVLRSGGSRARGDGRDPATYGFDLTTCFVDRATLVGGGLPRDGLPVLDLPALMTAAAVDSLNEAMRGKYLVPSDRVLGLVVGGVARAYPLRVLCWHEVVNDTLGGAPVAVAYNPLADSAAAFARAAGADTLAFGISGLLWNSCHLLYDRRQERGGESLWSPLLGRAVAGPAAAAGRCLIGLPLAVVRWDDWRAAHPATTVLFPGEPFRERYRRNPYSVYYGDDRLRFPAAPLPAVRADASGRERRLKEPLVAVTVGDSTRSWLLRDLAVAAGLPGGTLVWPESPGGAGGARGAAGAAASREDAFAGFRWRFDLRAEPLTVLVRPVPDPSLTSAAPAFSVVQAFRFAWESQRAAP